MFQVVTAPSVTALTTLAHAKGELQLTRADAARDAWLEELIQDASDAILDELDRPAIRQRVAERVSGTGRTTVLLDVTPVVLLESCVHDNLGAQVLGADRLAVSDYGAGILWRINGWPDDSPVVAGLTIDTVPQQGWSPWEVTYVGGWLTRAHDIQAEGVMASGQELRLPAGSLAPLLASGEQVLLKGFCEAANNRRFRVLARTDDTLVLDGTLATETAPDGSQVVVRTLPAGLERCCLDTIRAWYYARTSDPAVVQEKIGDWSATYKGGSRSVGGAASDVDNALPANVLRTLDRWKRMS